MSDTMEMTALIAKRDALKKAKNILKQELEYTRNEPCAIWRVRDEDWVDREGGIRSAVDDMTRDIIALELDMRDPIQDQEMRAEMYAEMAITGCRDDISLYFHTQEQEELFQERIRDDIEYGYYDPEDGWVDGINGHERPGKCYCGDTLWNDDCYNVNGWFMCEPCSVEAECFMRLVADITNGLIKMGAKWGGDPYIISYEDMLIREQEEREENAYYFMCFVAYLTNDQVGIGRGNYEYYFLSENRDG